MKNKCCIWFIVGTTFLCSEVIAPIRSEVDDISLYIINFEDLSNPMPVEAPIAPRLSKCKSNRRVRENREIKMMNFTPCETFDLVDRARASFKTKFGSMGLRDRGLRLAGYLTPPSDLAQEDDDNAERYHSNRDTSKKFSFSSSFISFLQQSNGAHTGENRIGQSVVTIFTGPINGGHNDNCDAIGGTRENSRLVTSG